MAKEENQKNTWKDQHLKNLIKNVVIICVTEAILIAVVVKFLVKDLKLISSEDAFLYVIIAMFFVGILSLSIAAGILIAKFADLLGDPKEDY